MIKINLQSLAIIIFLLFLIPSGNIIYANDSTENNSNIRKENFKLQFKGGHFYNGSSDKNELKYSELINGTQTSYNFDNPIVHGAFYFSTLAEYFQYGFNVKMNLIAEHRGASYGVYENDRMNIIPKFNISFDTVANIFYTDFRFGVSAGNYDNLRLYEGLYIYNMDTQGSNFFIQWKYFKLEYNKIADMYAWIGYNINDINDLILSLVDYTIFDDFVINYKIGQSQILGVFALENSIVTNYSLSISYKPYELYAQSGFKKEEGSKNIYDAYLIGFKGSNDLFGNTLKLNYNLAYRYFESGFNNNHYNSNQNYLESNGGASLYPIHLFERPFSQWATFTQFQGQGINGITLQLKARYNFYKDFYAVINLDYNWLNMKNENRLYDLFQYGLMYQPIQDAEFFAGVINYDMELRKAFPTFQLYTEPRMSLEAKFKLNYLFKLF